MPPEVERWLLARTADTSVRQLLHVPSHPFGWSAGKWREWYPDVAAAGDEGEDAVARMNVAPGERLSLTQARAKHMWQPGWWRQHQRLVRALAGQPRRAAAVFSGDLHAVGHAVLTASGELDLSANPLHAVLTGPLGTNAGWASAMRGTPPRAAIDVTLAERGAVREKNGFTVVDVTPEAIRVRLFAWRPEDGEAAIDALEPYHDATIRRP